MLKCLLYRHFVPPEIWCLSRDKLVLHSRIEHFYSTFSSRENNTQSKDHVMQMGKFIYTTLCIFKNLDKNTWMPACAKVFFWSLWLKHHTHFFLDIWGKIKVGSQLYCFAWTWVLHFGWADWAPLHTPCQARRGIVTFLRKTILNDQR